MDPWSAILAKAEQEYPTLTALSEKAANRWTEERSMVRIRTQTLSNDVSNAPIFAFRPCLLSLYLLETMNTPERA